MTTTVNLATSTAPQCVRVIQQCDNCALKFARAPEQCPECHQTKFIAREVYCLDKILSYGCFMNVVVGRRRGGKTYACTEYIVKNWVEKQEKAVWLRRYKTEAKKALESFTKFGYNFDNKGVYQEERIKNLDTGRMQNYKTYFVLFFSLSTASRLRGGEFPNFSTIVIDEYGDEYGTELRNEFTLINSIITSVFDEKEKVKAFVISNNVDRFLDLYQYLEVHWDEEWTYNWKRDAVIHVWDHKGFEMKGGIRKYLQGTTYYDYAFKNKPLDYDKWLIESYKIEFVPPIFCFRLSVLHQPIAVCLFQEHYIFNKCFECQHEVFIIDEYNAINHVAKIDRNKQKILLDYYFSKHMRFTSPDVKKEFFMWVNRNLHLAITW